MNKLQKKDLLLNEDTGTTNEKQRLKCWFSSSYILYLYWKNL